MAENERTGELYMHSKFFLFMIIMMFFSFKITGQGRESLNQSDRNNAGGRGQGNTSGHAGLDSASLLSGTQSENAAENKIIQPFEWESAGDVLKYEIKISEIDEKTGLKNQVYFHETTEEENETCLIYLEPLLPPGHYESEIKVYNVLGILEESLTAREEFVIRRAYMPEVRSVSYPLYMRSTIYLDDLDNDGIIEVDGRNLFMPDASGKELTLTNYFLKGNKTIYPDEVLSHDDERNRKIKFRFDMKKLDVGLYHMYAQDASGLHSEENSDSELIVKFKKWMDLDVEGGYTCPVVLHDDTFPTYLEKMLPMSAQAKITFIPFKHSWGYLGIGLRGNYSRLSKEEDGYTIDGNLGMAHLLFVYQLPMFRRRVVAELHGGAGFTYFNNIVFHFPHDINSVPLNTLSISFDVGAGFQIYINKRLYTEIASDYVFTMNKDMILGTLLPSAGIGWQF